MLNDKININLFDTEKGSRIQKEYSCAQCRAAVACAGLGECKLVDYLRTRTTDMQYNIYDNGASLNIESDHDNFFKTLTVINRAIRLRKHRYK